MFRFTVDHLAFLARAPGVPQLFDSLPLVTTTLLLTPCPMVTEPMETYERSLPEMRLQSHHLRGTEFVSAEQ